MHEKLTMHEFYTILPEQYFPRFFFFGGGANVPRSLLPSPTPVVYTPARHCVSVLGKVKRVSCGELVSVQRSGAVG